MGITKNRFDQNSGIRYLKDGVSVRCQGRAKTRLTNARLRYYDSLVAKALIPEDYLNMAPMDFFNFVYVDNVDSLSHLLPNDYPNNDFWPDVQCSKPVVEGSFACKLHGGSSPNITPITIEEYLPLDLAEIFTNIRDDPGLLASYENIKLLRARRNQLLHNVATGEYKLDGKSLSNVMEAYSILQTAGSVRAALIYLERAINSATLERDTWDEIREIEKLETQAKKTQWGMEKDMRTMATVDQIKQSFENHNRIFFTVVEEELEDPAIVNRLLRRLALEINKQMGMSVPAGGKLLDESE